MLEHQQSHTDNYRFRCSTCNKGFTRQSYYRDHKCPAAGSGTAGEGGAAESEGDEATGMPVAAEKDGEDGGRRSGFLRTESMAGGDDGANGGGSKDGHESAQRREQEEEEEEEERRNDEGCRAAMTISGIEGQEEEEEEDEDEEEDDDDDDDEDEEEEEEEVDRVEHGAMALDQIQSNDQHCLQQQCL